MNKLFTLFLIVSLLSNSALGADNNLKATFDEFNYSMTVEWDQQDQIYYQKKMNTFIQELNRLDLTQNEIMSFIESQINNRSTSKEIKDIMKLVSINKISHEKARQMYIETMVKSYQTGASFSGRVAVGALIAIDVIGILALLYFVSGIRYSGSFYCEDYFPCELFLLY